MGFWRKNEYMIKENDKDVRFCPSCGKHVSHYAALCSCGEMVQSNIDQENIEWRNISIDKLITFSKKRGLKPACIKGKPDEIDVTDGKDAHFEMIDGKPLISRQIYRNILTWSCGVVPGHEDVISI